MRCSGILGLSVACALAFQPAEDVSVTAVRSEDRWDSLVQFHAQQAGIDWRVVKTIMLVESSGNPNSISPVGARGLMQLMPRTIWEWIDGTLGIGGSPPSGWRESAMDPDVNLRVATQHIYWLTSALSRKLPAGQVQSAVFAAYFDGYGKVRSHIDHYGQLRREFLPRETQRYVDRATKILTMMEHSAHGG